LARRFGRERSLARFESAVFGTQSATDTSIASQITSISSGSSDREDGK
jgi:hypothetical protein